MQVDPSKSLASGDRYIEPLPADYEMLSGCQKREELWKRVERTRYASAPQPKKVDLSAFALRFLSAKVEWRGDEVPAGHRKAIHAVGAVAMVRFQAEPGHRLSGLFSNTDVCGLLRLSLTEAPGSVAPGLALKLFVTGQSSANVSALVDLDGQSDNHNFFANEMATMVDRSVELKGKASSLLFRLVTQHPRALGLSGFARVDKNGQAVDAPLYPYLVYFVPVQSVRNRFGSSPRNVLDDLSRVTPLSLDSDNGVIYEVWAPQPQRNSREGALDALEAVERSDKGFRQSAEHIGSLILDSSPVASQYGDQKLFFYHERYENE
jgi:hypothetical protein